MKKFNKLYWIIVGLFIANTHLNAQQVQVGDMLYGAFADGKPYVGEVLTVKNTLEFTLRFSHSGSVYNLETSPVSPQHNVARVIGSKGGKYGTGELFSFYIFRYGTGGFLKVKFADGKSFLAFENEGKKTDKYWVVYMLHSGNEYKMGYDKKVYETGKGAYKAGTGFDIWYVDCMSTDKGTAPKPNQVPKGYKKEAAEPKPTPIENLKRNTGKGYEKLKKEVETLFKNAKAGLQKAGN